MISLALRFAAILSTLIGIANITAFEFDLRELNSEKNIAILFSILSIIAVLFFGMKKVRTDIYKNEQTYGQAFYGGVVITLFTSIGAGVYTLIYMQFIRPNYYELLLPVLKKNMKNFGMGEKEIAAELANYQSGNVASSFIATFFLTLFYMLIISTILAAFIRTKDTFSAENES